MDRMLDDTTLRKLLTALGQNFLRQKTIQDMAKEQGTAIKSTGTNNQDEKPAQTNKIKSTKNYGPDVKLVNGIPINPPSEFRKEFEHPIGTPSVYGPLPTASTIEHHLMQLHTTEELIRYMEGSISAIPKMAEVIMRSYNSNVSWINAGAAQVFGYLAIAKSPDVVELSIHQGIATWNRTMSAVNIDMGSGHLAALANWIRHGGDFAEVTAEFNNHITDLRHALPFYQILASIVHSMNAPAKPAGGQ